jgi:hypothetical protein
MAALKTDTEDNKARLPNSNNGTSTNILSSDMLPPPSDMLPFPLSVMPSEAQAQFYQGPKCKAWAKVVSTVSMTNRNDITVQKWTCKEQLDKGQKCGVGNTTMREKIRK